MAVENWPNFVGFLSVFYASVSQWPTSDRRLLRQILAKIKLDSSLILALITIIIRGNTVVVGPKDVPLQHVAKARHLTSFFSSFFLAVLPLLLQ